jgi:Transglycosylase SLT domain
MRRAIVAVLASASLLVPASTAVAQAAQQTVPVRVCDYDWRAGTWHIKQLIKCAARRWDSPGTPDQAVAVADCESNLNPRAYSSSGYAGLFQQSTRYWPVRADQWGQDDRSVYNARANIIVSVRMAHAAGSWSPWAGCA